MGVLQQTNRLDEVIVRKEFDIHAAIESIRFYWNLARQKGETIVVEVWRQKTDPLEKGG